MNTKKTNVVVIALVASSMLVGGCKKTSDSFVADALAETNIRIEQFQDIAQGLFKENGDSFVAKETIPSILKVEIRKREILKSVSASEISTDIEAHRAEIIAKIEKALQQERVLLNQLKPSVDRAIGAEKAVVSYAGGDIMKLEELGRESHNTCVAVKEIVTKMQEIWKGF